LEHGHPALCGDVPSEGGLPVRPAAVLVARAFVAYTMVTGMRAIA
jgi:hypothetical protein